jgi:uncharacterized protein YqjF (DUF2071 family)
MRTLKPTMDRAPARPAGPWVLAQTWHDLLFAHWPVPPEMVRPLLPPGVTLDTFDGQAWLGIVAFWMSGIRLRGLPPVPFTAGFPEINVRTYVQDAARPAVFFMSLDADNAVGIALARRWYHLPYFRARIALTRRPGAVTFASRRTEPGAAPAAFTGAYGPVAAGQRSAPGTLEHWLTERYRFYTADQDGQVYRGDMQHEPWLLQAAGADIRLNTLIAAHGLPVPQGAPILHYARQTQAVFWWPERLAPAARHGQRASVGGRWTHARS